jgi:hypothetical protein
MEGGPPGAESGERARSCSPAGGVTQSENFVSSGIFGCKMEVFLVEKLIDVRKGLHLKQKEREEGEERS